MADAAVLASRLWACLMMTSTSARLSTCAAHLDLLDVCPAFLKKCVEQLAPDYDIV